VIAWFACPLFLHKPARETRRGPSAGYGTPTQRPLSVWTASVEKILEKIARARRRLEEIQPGCFPSPNAEPIAYLIQKHYTRHARKGGKKVGRNRLACDSSVRWASSGSVSSKFRRRSCTLRWASARSLISKVRRICLPLNFIRA